MNCPNCKKPSESKIIDGLEYVNCETCGFLRLEKDGSATALTESPAGWNPPNRAGGEPPELDKDAKPTPAVDAGQIDGKVKDEISAVTDVLPPESVKLPDDDVGDEIEINLHIEAEDE